MLPVSVDHFNHLANSGKYALLEDHGIYLDCFYISNSYKICLFALFHYYVEVYYREANDKLLGALAFDDDAKLQPFLESTDISPVVSLL